MKIQKDPPEWLKWTLLVAFLIVVAVPYFTGVKVICEKLLSLVSWF